MRVFRLIPLRCLTAQASLCGLVLGLLGMCVPAARADKIDEGLTKNALAIMKELEKQYSTVGVLKFQVQAGKAEPNMRVGRLNSLMATKLENALIMAASGKTVVTRNASTSAVKRDAKATYTTDAGRQKLFNYTYPLAWGKNLDSFSSVDAFVTGLVQVDYTTLKSTVAINVFDKNNLQLRQINRFDVPLDRQILDDMNLAVTVVRRDLKLDVDPDGVEKVPEQRPAKVEAVGVGGTVGDIPPDKEKDKEKYPAPAVKIVVPYQPPPPEVAKNPEYKPLPEQTYNIKDVLDFKVFYDGYEVPYEGVALKNPPKPGQKVHFTVKSTKKVGLVLAVNGIATWGSVALNEVPPNECPLWVLDPGELYTIEGFFPKPKKMLPFVVKAREDMSAAEMYDAQKVGQISLFVFFEDDYKGGAVAKPPAGTEGSRRGVTIPMTSLREESLPKLREAITKRRNVILGGLEQVANVDVATFGRRVSGPSLHLFYFRADAGLQE